MPSDNERTKILEMIEEGVITAEEGIRLLDALGQTADPVKSDPEPAQLSGPAYSDNPADPYEPYTVVSPAENIESQADTSAVETDSDFQNESLPPDFDPAPDSAVLEPDQVYDPPPSPPDKEDIQRWKRWWVIPMWIGVGVTVVGGALMYAAFANSGIGFWFACAWFPFMLGVAVMAFAWRSRIAPWLHVRVQQSPGETPQRIAISFPIPIRLISWGLRTFGHRIPNMEGVDLANMLDAVEESAKDGTPFFVDVADEDGERVRVFIG